LPTLKGVIVNVFDCGATNVRTMQLTAKVKFMPLNLFPNNTRPGPFFPPYRIWDIKEIWEKMCQASRKVGIGNDRWI
jgi:L-fuculokinase